MLKGQLEIKTTKLCELRVINVIFSIKTTSICTFHRNIEFIRILKSKIRIGGLTLIIIAAERYAVAI